MTGQEKADVRYLGTLVNDARGHLEAAHFGRL
jgi:hypothetical protein